MHIYIYCIQNYVHIYKYGNILNQEGRGIGSPRTTPSTAMCQGVERRAIGDQFMAVTIEIVLRTILQSRFGNYE